MFSDRLRWLKAILPGILLLLLCAHYAHLASTLPIGWRACMADPASQDGVALRFPLYTVSRIEGPMRYTISKTLRDIPIEGPTEGLSAGDTVSVRAAFRATDQVAVEDSRAHHPLRRAKQLLGLLGLLWFFALVHRSFGWQGGRVVERG